MVIISVKSPELPEERHALIPKVEGAISRASLLLTKTPLDQAMASVPIASSLEKRIVRAVNHVRSHSPSGARSEQISISGAQLL